MTDPIQDAINKTLGTPKSATVEERLEEAVGLLRQAKEQRRIDLEKIVDLQGDVQHYDEANSILVAQRDSANERCRAMKDQINRIPRWLRALFRA